MYSCFIIDIYLCYLVAPASLGLAVTDGWRPSALSKLRSALNFFFKKSESFFYTKRTSYMLSLRVSTGTCCFLAGGKCYKSVLKVKLACIKKV